MERFEDEFVTWHHKTPVGIKIDEVFGMDCRDGKVWLEFARQIFCEQGVNDYREIGHFENGAPFIYGLNARISISHANHLFVGAFLPKTPEADLSVFSPRTAMGIDAEALDREQVLKIRSKFLSPEEIENIPENDLIANIKAWTSKEALYKAAFNPGIDWKSDLIIKRLPGLDKEPEKLKTPDLGKAILRFHDADTIIDHEMNLYSYESYGCCVTIAYSPKCAKFGNH